MGNRTFIDDNYGVWDMEDEDDLDFYNQVQAESVEKKCVCCGRMVRLRPEYDKCGTCADILEQGGDPCF